MKRKNLLILAFAVTVFVQCSKDKNDDPIDLTKGLLAVFKMDNEFNDSTGNIPVTVFTASGIKAVPDRKGNLKSAMYFDEGYMSATMEDWSANPFTVSCWVHPKNNINDNYFLLSDGGVFGFYQSEDEIGFTISTPATNTAMTSLDTGWIHIAGTFDGKDIRTYIDGKLAATLHHPGEPEFVDKFTVGSFEAPWWKGVIDDLRFYSRVLSEKEISLLAGL